MYPGIEPKEVQQAWFGSLVSGFTGSRVTTALKLPCIPITRVENFCSGGSHALGNACYAVAAGICDIALAVGVEKLTDRFIGFAYPNPEPFDSSKALGEFQPINMFSQMALRYFYVHGWTVDEGREVLAKIAVKNHHNGTLFPKAHLRREITIDEALNAPIITYPLGLYDCCPISDGAAAAVIVRSDMAKSFRDDYILVKAIGFASGDGQVLLRDDHEFIKVASENPVLWTGMKDASAKVWIWRPMAIRRVAHVVYHTKYNLVWAPKYRKWIKREDIRRRVKEIFEEIAEHHGFEIQEMRVEKICKNCEVKRNRGFMSC